MVVVLEAGVGANDRPEVEPDGELGPVAALRAEGRRALVAATRRRVRERGGARRRRRSGVGGSWRRRPWRRTEEAGGNRRRPCRDGDRSIPGFMRACGWGWWGVRVWGRENGPVGLMGWPALKPFF